MSEPRRQLQSVADVTNVAPVNPGSLGATYWLTAGSALGGDGNPVTSWPPEVGSGTPAPGTGPTSRASTAAFGSKPTVEYEDTADSLTVAAGIVPLEPCTIHIVGQFLTGTYVWGQTRASGGHYGQRTPMALRYEDGATAISGTLDPTDAAMYSWVLESGTDGLRFVKNAVEVSTHSTHTFVASGAGVTFFLGGIPTAGFTGHIADFFIVPIAQSDAQIAAFYAWAQGEYGI